MKRMLSMLHKVLQRRGLALHRSRTAQVAHTCLQPRTSSWPLHIPMMMSGVDIAVPSDDDLDEQDQLVSV